MCSNYLDEMDLQQKMVMILLFIFFRLQRDMPIEYLYHNEFAEEFH